MTDEWKEDFFLKRDYYLKNLVVDILVDAREGVGDTKAQPARQCFHRHAAWGNRFTAVFFLLQLTSLSS